MFVMRALFILIVTFLMCALLVLCLIVPLVEHTHFVYFYRYVSYPHSYLFVVALEMRALSFFVLTVMLGTDHYFSGGGRDEKY